MEAKRPNYVYVIENLKLMELLSEFCPLVIGTPPLGIDIESSDIDIACTCNDLPRFQQQCSSLFGGQKNFKVVNTTAQDIPTVIVRFTSHGWDIETFCQPIQVDEQWGVRHFQIEQRILAIDDRVAESIRKMKRSGIKTEPAFAQLLGLKGDPYASLLELESKSNDELEGLLSQNIDFQVH